MRIHRLSFLILSLLVSGCGGSAEPSGAAVEFDDKPSIGPGEAVCRVLEPDPAAERWGWKSFRAEIDCGGPGRVEVLWGDRVPEPAPGEPYRTRTVCASSTHEPGTIQVEFAYRFVPGQHVLFQYLKPIGGEAAVAAARQAVPGIDRSILGLKRVACVSKNGAGWGGGPILAESLPPSGASSATVMHPVGSEIPLAPGKHVLLWRRLWSDTTGVSTSGPVGAEPHVIRVNGKVVPIGEYRLPVWTIHVRFTPAE